MEPNNPISQVLDQTFTSVLDDPKRPLEGFVKFARFSIEFERFQRQHLANFLTSNSDYPSKVYFMVSQAVQMGFEAGKNYIINGGVDKMLAMEDEWNHKNEQPSS